MTDTVRLTTLPHHRMTTGISQRTLAKRVGVSYQTIRRLEHGEDAGELPVRIIARIAATLKVDLPTLLADETDAIEVAPSTSRLRRDQVFLLRRIARDEPVSQLMSQAERTTTLPSLIKSGLVTMTSGKPALSSATLHSLQSRR